MLKVALVVIILIAAVLIIAASRPDTFTIQRSRTIQAPPEKIFALIDDFYNWNQWAPQDREDSTMKRTFSGPESGTGAVSEWKSSGSAGSGKMMIAESTAPRKISVKVDFARPFEAHNVNEFTLERSGTSTTVTWSMQGTNLFIMKLMGVAVSMDRMVGKHFDSGLDNLKATAEK
jgi:uncharacterized protein YndB with AHSA1/START domain